MSENKVQEYLPGTLIGFTDSAIQFIVITPSSLMWTDFGSSIVEHRFFNTANVYNRITLSEIFVGEV